MSSSFNMMYHFVGMDKKYRGTSLIDFKYQLNYLQKNCDRKDYCLTFDHGTIDHYEIVMPELEKRNLKGVFFIMTMVPEEVSIPAIDKQRFLEGNYRQDLVKFLCEDLKIKYNPNDGASYQSLLTFYSLEERYLRFLRDIVLPTVDFNKAISSVFSNIFGNEFDFSKKYYMDWVHIKQLKEKGHIIGSHSHSHKGDYMDYKTSFALINKHFKIEDNNISYPNGNNILKIQELKDLNINKAYISRSNGDTLYNIGRIDDKYFHLVESIKK